MTFWDSVIPLAESYVRGCGFHNRHNYPYNYYYCFDNFHTGYIVEGLATQMIVNFMCNSVLANTANHDLDIALDTCCYN